MYPNMSSYQFVNSLTSCYGQRGGDSSSQDYYTPQVQTYGGCYSGPGSPVQQYGPYPQHSIPHLQNGGGDHHFNSCSQRLTHPNASQSPRTPTPSVTPVPSCKYAEPSTASPQDLSTNASHPPPPASSPESRTSPVVSPRQSSQQPPATVQHHSSSSQPSAQQAPNPSTQSQAQQQQQQQASPQQAQAAPQPTQDSTSPQQGQQKPNYTNNPPQIYPWMRKVHVGQSKCQKTRTFILYFSPCLLFFNYTNFRILGNKCCFQLNFLSSLIAQFFLDMSRIAYFPNFYV